MHYRGSLPRRGYYPREYRGWRLARGWVRPWDGAGRLALGDLVINGTFASFREVLQVAPWVVFPTKAFGPPYYFARYQQALWFLHWAPKQSTEDLLKVRLLWEGLPWYLDKELYRLLQEVSSVPLALVYCELGSGELIDRITAWTDQEFEGRMQDLKKELGKWQREGAHNAASLV